MHLANFEGKRASTVESIKKAFEDDKITRDDVFLNVRMAQGTIFKIISIINYKLLICRANVILYIIIILQALKMRMNPRGKKSKI